MHPVRIALAASLILAANTAATANAQAPTKPTAPPLYGFSAAHAAEERALEARFDSFLKPEDQGDWMRRLTARPHPIGSPWGKENAEFMAGLFRSWGYDTRIEEFKVLFPTPKLRRLELIAPSRFTAGLTEPPIAEEHSSGQAEQLPPYNAYSPDGDVTGDLVYVNFGRRQDYAELARRGIDVKGKIVLARYGGGWRGMKPKVAAEQGAIGCILFSDPREGYYQGDVYPAGGWMPDQGVQRGSVLDDTFYGGDPLTPHVGATADAKRLPREEARTLPRIPVLPISYADALPLLKALGGPVAPEAWRGLLAVTYHIGPGPARVHLQLAFDWNMVTAYDVIARLAGSERPEEWILRGNHHDAWVNGASDPVSALVALLGEAKAVGALARKGWRPKRTILYAAWDGEEPGLLGSVEWAETHAAELSDHLAAYVNSDGNARGFAWTSGVASLTTLVNQVYRDVTDPEKNVSVAARLNASALLDGSPDEQRAAGAGKPLPLKPFTVAIDYTPFLAYLGVPILDTSYGGEEEYGVYHTSYDTYDHFNRFVDPGFRYGVVLSQTAGRIVLRLAGADVFPLDFVPFAEALDASVKRLIQRTGAQRDESAETNQRIADGTYALADDPLHPHLPPKLQEPIPSLDFTPLQKAVARLTASAAAYAAAMDHSTGGSKDLDRILLHAERTLLRSEGLPGRPWYRHQLYGPSVSTGSVTLFPGVSNAIEQHNWQEAADQIDVTAKVIESYAQQVDRAGAVLGPQIRTQ
jgi:N-acetylated-alpha-linked acidic dipeptidase